MNEVRIFICLSVLLTFVHGWGYRYYFNPNTEQVNLWSFVPGQDEPLVRNIESNYLGADPVLLKHHNYARTFGAGENRWNCNVGASYSEIFQKCVWKSGYFPQKSDLAKYKYFDRSTGAGENRWNCKAGASYSEELRKCVWNPGYYGANRYQFFY